MKWFSNLKIRTRLLLGYFIAILFMLLIGAVSLHTSQQILSSLHTVYADRVVPISQIKEVGNSYLIGIIDAAHKANAKKISYDVALTQIKASETKADRIWATYLSTFLVEDEKVLIAKLEKEFPPLKLGIQRLESILLAKDEKALDTFVRDEMYPVFDPITGHLEELIQVQLKVAKHESESSEQDFRESMVIFIGMFLLIVFVVIVMAVFMSGSISNPMKEIVKAANAIAIGDLNVSISKKLITDSENINEQIVSKSEIKILVSAFLELVQFIKERSAILEKIAMSDLTSNVALRSEQDTLGKSLKLMLSNLTSIIEKLSFTSQEVDLGAQQLADASTSLSEAASEQASAVEEISATLTEIGNSFISNADNASRMTQLSQTTSQFAADGNEKMRELITAMHEISASFEQISKINKVINDIAFQTNILALNAAVEAARAGQHGKGFAVVADEVRNLAQKSANAADETTNLIENSLLKVRSGNLATEKAADVLQKIGESAESVNALTNDLSLSIHEQKSAVMQITQGVDQVTTVTSMTAASAEEVAASSETLKRQVEVMRSLILGFKISTDQNSTALVRLD
ncbi:MAG: methyl-accepting chemotaxis protein [Leptospira sp.]|nr:methyl-accepting chemotaxis protein [Leptospira sp.]